MVSLKDVLLDECVFETGVGYLFEGFLNGVAMV